MLLDVSARDRRRGVDQRHLPGAVFLHLEIGDEEESPHCKHHCRGATPPARARGVRTSAEHVHLHMAERRQMRECPREGTLTRSPPFPPKLLLPLGSAIQDGPTDNGLKCPVAVV